MTFRLCAASLQEFELFRFNSTTLASTLLKAKDCRRIVGVAFSPDNSCLVVGEKDQISLIALTLNESNQAPSSLLIPLPVLEHPAAGVGLHPNASSNPSTIPINYSNISCIGFGRKSARYVYIGVTSLKGSSQLFKLVIWDRKEAKYLQNEVSLPSAPCCFAITTDDQKIAIGLENGIAIHSLKHNTTTMISNPFEGAVTCVDFYPFKKSVLIAGGQDGSVALWDLNASSSPSTIKKRVHGDGVSAVAFAPCNKHFYCSVGLDSMIHFHDINSGNTGKGLLQSYQADSPLLSLSINDDHTVAMGNTKGNVLIYDLRQKQLIHKIETGNNHPLKFLSFQPPKWATTAALKDSFISDRKTVQAWTDKEQSADAQVALTPPSVEPIISNLAPNVLDMFSPVNKNKIQKSTVPGDLRKTATLGLFQEKLKKASMSMDQLALPAAAVPSPALRTTKSQDITPTPSPTSLNAISDSKSTTETIPIMEDMTPSSIHSKNEDSMASVVTAPFNSNTPKPPAPLIAAQSAEALLAESVRRVRVGGLTGSSQTPSVIMKSMANSISSSKNLTDSQKTQDNGQQNHLRSEDDGNNNISSFQYQVIKGIVEDVMFEQQEQTRLDIQNIHLELLRQFQYQKADMQKMLDSHIPTGPLLAMIEKLQIENDRLRRNY